MPVSHCRKITAAMAIACCPGAHAGGPLFTDLAAGAHDARIVTANPAGMTHLEAASWRAGAIVSYSESTWEAESSNLPIATETETDDTVYIPALFYSRPVGERWAAGISLSATSGLGDDGGEDSASRYISSEWSVGSFTAMPALAYELSDEWSVGAGLGINYTVYSSESAVFNGPGQPDGEVEFEPDDLVLNFVLGVHWKPGPRTRFGLSYRSEYEPEMDDSPDYSNVDPDRQRDEDIELEITMPQSVLAGAYHEFRNGQWLSLDVMWIDADQFNIETAIVDEGGDITPNPFRLNDTWVGSLGWGMPLNERWEVGLGAMYVHDPIDEDNRTPILRVDSLWGLGASLERHRPNGAVLGASLAYLFTGDAPVETPELPIVGVISGEYSDRTNVLFEVFYSW